MSSLPNFEKAKYKCPRLIHYTSRRYNKSVIVPKGYPSDGATGAIDLMDTDSWWVHDKLCDTGVWEDGTPCTNLQASLVVYDILKSERRWFRARTWFAATWLIGGGKCRDNGMI